MGLFIVFLLGIANFAAHKAVLQSGHRVLAQLPWLFRPLGGRFSLVLEFAMLLGTLLVVGQGTYGWAAFYAAYTAVNLTSAWLILSGRV